MAKELTDSQISLLCDLAEYNELKASAAQRRDLERLVDDGYVAIAEGDTRPRLKPTTKGMEFLGERGAGLNEA